MNRNYEALRVFILTLRVVELTSSANILSRAKILENIGVTLTALGNAILIA